MADLDAALNELGFGGKNVTASHEAFEAVRLEKLPGELAMAAPPAPSGPVAGILDDVVGGMPQIQTGDWATRNPHRQELLPPCNNGCPAGNNVQGFVAAVGKQDYTKAVGIILETSPFPGVCGRVCPAPCMEACNRRLHDESVNIRELERSAGQRGERPAPTKPWRGERVAVIGSGPAGLSAAYHLARLGYRVAVFEGGEELGGVMRTGIPSYRLPRAVLDQEIAYILQHGIVAKARAFVDQAGLLELTRTHAAVFVGTGLQGLRWVDLGPGARSSGESRLNKSRLNESRLNEACGVVIQGIEFLERVRQEEESLAGLDVVVVGGGNTAMDAARSARRIGARSVRIVYRRTRDEMPAIKEEIEEALEEGIALDELVAPVRIQHDGLGTVLTCNRMRLGPPDDSGRPRPIPETSEDAFFDLRCDRVILALGQSSDLSILPEGGEIRENGKLLGLTGAPVFCAGDVATNEGTVTAAIGGGRKAAWHIHKTLTGEDLFPATTPSVAGSEAMKLYVFAHEPRRHGMVIAPDVRRRSFTEVRRGFDGEGGAETAVEEAQRCLSCGVCNSCDRCQTYCPEGILVRDGDCSYRFEYSYCKGCGICATQCPRGVIYMAEL
jgi:NADPH-dependent glutamate synthase beta subunit-like oxidoreductase/Pyruvate/2-oxoacid:ferredoxin oxidoreductase delta subunit